VNTILVTGRHGQVGWELCRTLLPLGQVTAVGRSELDLADLCALRDLLRAVKPSLIVNAAAYTAVDKAESEPDLALRINGEAPALLADEAARSGALLVHYSTDYVFNGAKDAPYSEYDAPNPLGAYGRSKLAGERAILESGARHLIFRTSWVYGARGGNFLRTIVRLSRERDELRVVADQVGAPTWCRLIAETTALALEKSMTDLARDEFESGLYHLTAAGSTSWHGFASAIVEQARRRFAPGEIKARSVVPISSAEYPLPAQRPANSRLSCAKLSQRFGVTLPAWQTGLALCMEEMTGGGQ
jgi:dTDP-4-dehydrorhamnose reductase